MGLEFKKVTSAGQVNEGDQLVLYTRQGIIQTVAREVINPGVVGAPEGEEVVYNRSKNHYFITNMVVNGDSWVREAYVIHLT